MDLQQGLIICSTQKKKKILGLSNPFYCRLFQDHCFLKPVGSRMKWILEFVLIGLYGPQKGYIMLEKDT